MKTFTTGILLITLITLSGHRCKPHNPVKTALAGPTCMGYPFLKFKIKTPDGAKYSNANFKNKIVFVSFWAQASPACLQELPAFNELFEKLKDSTDFVFVAFSPDDDSIIRRTEAENKIGYPIYHMPPQQCIKINYGHGFPSNFVLNRSGRITYYRPRLFYNKELDPAEIMANFYPRIMEML